MRFSKVARRSFIIFLIAISVTAAFAQLPSFPETFRAVVEKRLKHQSIKLGDVCPIDANSAARRIFSDYGAIFLSKADDRLPSRCIFASEREVMDFQNTLESASALVGGTSVTLRRSAMDALLAAREEAIKKGLNITPRGGTTASKRTFEETVKLWNSRFLPGLDHWVASGKLSRTDADSAKKATIPVQVEKVLDWEKNGLYFSKDFSKSILYSVAAPGASQHIFLLALDVEQYSNRAVRQILAEHGWFQTVRSDLPHFTYLGVTEKELPALGLRSTKVSDQTFWIPDFD